MDILEKDAVPFPNICEWCLAIGTNRCSRCHVAYYCCREHQIQHWSIHKSVCQKSLPPIMPINALPPVNIHSSGNSFSSFGNYCQTNAPNSKNDDINQIVVPTSSPMTMPMNSRVVVPTSNPMTMPTNSHIVVPTSNEMAMPTNRQMAMPMSSQMAVPTNMYDPSNCSLASEKSVDFHIPDEDEIFSSITSELLSSDNNFWALINSCDSQSISDYGAYLEKETINQVAGTDNNPTINAHISTSNESSSTTDDVHIMQSASLNDICSNVVHDLNTYGICVLDKFLGKNYGNLILQEVKNLYLKGIFKKGELVNPSPYASKESIRSDVITWIDGSEPNCKHIGNLMRKLDVVVTTCNKMPNNGLLSKYKLHRRTKAMIACYPGDGTYYKKHIDNPHKDGRCITCIYYLNQNWDTKIHGGLLRMFPSAYDSQVANIEPIFDRMIFFWSDKRNPHEVLPSFATRFAITVWYFDADERDQAVKMSRNRALMKSPNKPFVHK